MRKKTQNRLFDNIFWYFVYMLPLLAMVIFIAKNGATDFSIINCFQTLGITIFDNNIIYTALIDIFGSTGAFPVFSDYGLLMLMSYYVCCFLVHIVVDFLLLLPRICLKFGDKMGGED